MSKITPTDNAINLICSKELKESQDPSTFPTLQIIKCGIPKSGLIPVLLSDGKAYCSASISTNPQIVKNTMIQISKFSIKTSPSNELSIYVKAYTIQGDANQELYIVTSGKLENMNKVATKDNTFEHPAPATSSAAGKSPEKKVETKSNLLNPWFPVANLRMGDAKNKLIKVRCFSKRDMLAFKNGNGKLFSAIFEDEAGTQINATFFNKEADNFYELIQIGSVYSMTRFQLVPAKKQYSQVKNDYEIAADIETVITLLRGDNASFKAASSNTPLEFKKIQNISQCKVGDIIDILGVVIEVCDFKASTSKAGTPVYRRNISLIDETGYKVEVTVWGKSTEAMFERENSLNKMVAITNCKIGSFNDKISLGTSATSAVHMNYNNVAHTSLLVKWWKENCDKEEELKKSCNTVSTAIGITGGGGTGGGGLKGEKRTLAEIRDLKLEDKEVKYSEVFATITKIKVGRSEEPGKKTFYYNSCPNKECYGKGLKDNTCPKCLKKHVSGVLIYSFQVELSDHTMAIECSTRGDISSRILGDVKVDDLAMYDGSHEYDKIDTIVKSSEGKGFNFSILSKISTFNEMSRLQHEIKSIASPV